MSRDSTISPPLDGAPEEALADLEPAGDPPPPVQEALAKLAEEELPVISTEELAAPLPSGEPPEIDPAKLDGDALKVVHRLLHFGHQAYLVGGCVRDLLVGRRPKDFDVATSAHPGEVRAIFRNCRLIGRRFRLAHVYFKGGKIIEVSTFRANPLEVEGPEVSDRLEPPEVEGDSEAAEREPNGLGEAAGEEDLLITHDNVFGTAEQDARRRDFTINGLFYDIAQGKVIDYVRGRRDLDERFVRTIGDPERRMREDPVRILRAVRFACKLGFDVESRTYAAMEGAVEDLPRCAPPRLLEETFRLIRGGSAAPSIKLLSALDALRILMPPVDAYLREQGAEGERLFYAVVEAMDQEVAARGSAPDDAVLLAALLLPLSAAQEPASRAPAAEGQGDPVPADRVVVAQPVEALLSELVRTARLPRRIAERCRAILFSQKILSGERRRRGSLASFRRHPLFEEALAVFSLWVRATGQHRDALAAWQAGSAPEPRPDSAPLGRRRNRRGRRRRRGPPSGERPGGASEGPGRQEKTPDS